MKISGKASILQIAESNIFYVKNKALMTMVQWKSGCDYYLLSYELLIT